VFVLGVDPGVSRCGYGLVGRDERDGSLSARSAGVIETDPATPMPERLFILQTELSALLREFDPAVVVVERVFFQVNVKTAVSVCQASGLALAAAAGHGCEVAEYTANEVKQALVGYGSATKEQVQRMVAEVLGLAQVPKPPDAADALALAVCHLSSHALRRAVRLASDGALGSGARGIVARATVARGAAS
jgi:crossover junction endodeoxyribonuclease RuvC